MALINSSDSDRADAEKYADRVLLLDADAFNADFELNWRQMPTPGYIELLRGEDGKEILMNMFLAARNGFRDAMDGKPGLQE